MIDPRWGSVFSLYALQKSMMLMPCGPSAVPTGGAGVAWPAGIWIFTIAASFFFAIFPFAPSLRRRVPAPRTLTRRRALHFVPAPRARCRALLELRDLAEL